MAFEVFTKRMVPLVQQPYVTLQKRGTISMNRSAYHALGEPAAVELLYDREASVVGFRAVEPTVEHAYALRAMGARKEDSGTFMLSGTAFFKYYEIDTSEARRYPATMNEGVLCLDLSQEGTVVTSNRSGSGARSQHDNAGDAAGDGAGTDDTVPA